MAFEQGTQREYSGTLMYWIVSFVILILLIFLLNIGIGIISMVNTAAENITTPTDTLTAEDITYKYGAYIYGPIISIVLVVAGVLLAGYMIANRREEDSGGL